MIRDAHAAVLRGKVLDRAGQPMAGVTVTVLDRAEFGSTITRADGWFDLAVNGGELMVLDYRKPGYLPVQRKIDVPWRDYAIGEDVVLTAYDDALTSIALGSADWQLGSGSQTSDARGNRTARVFFPPGTQATLHFADGRTQALDRLGFRATEYTSGERGMAAMPGELPMSVGYTYAVELSADEAIAAGAERVEFDRPLPLYVDNFLAFPAGTIVPLGWYDYRRAAWIGDENGVVLEILAIRDGLAEVRVSEENRPATAAELAALGIDIGELRLLARTYAVGASLWRSRVRHFTPWDCNVPYGPPPGGDSPPPPDIDPDTDPDRDEECQSGQDCDCKEGCEIHPSRALGQSIRIPGSPFDLYYRSNRTGSRGAYPVPLTRRDAPVPASLRKIEARIDIAGRRFVHEVLPPFSSGMRWEFVWDGRDAYGRRVAYGARALVNVMQQYPLVLHASRTAAVSAFSAVYARSDTGAAGLWFARDNANTWLSTSRRWEAFLSTDGSLDVQFSNAGSWTLAGLKVYDPSMARVYAGAGKLLKGARLARHFENVATAPSASFSAPLSLPVESAGPCDPAHHPLWHGHDAGGRQRRGLCG